MSNQNLRVVARFIALPNKVEELKALLLSVIAPTRQEAGVISYELLQNQSDPTDFTFVEEWTSAEALETHLNTPHIQAALGKLEGLLAAAPDISRYNLLA
ncbi:antibiotic biosynthesis monooxygenase [Nostoc sp. FACHB-87]|uniref:putative quinol monooxygenase n=1 Tax=Nostocaceae TaxID=1162 RepID=UPI0016835FBE|nr:MULTISPECIES: putative quinol monooxygenase [Nostocaceae]MBD2453957.1 antibiotic biosynthesis monooxygenase [Nostoc sp. FACHB-87]MBD2476082.1 antibiotic biosynthesis monooxygenase [Anabaena sp. FACHB-83]